MINKNVGLFAAGAIAGSVFTIGFTVRTILLHEPTMAFLAKAVGEALADKTVESLNLSRPAYERKFRRTSIADA